MLWIALNFERLSLDVIERSCHQAIAGTTGANATLGKTSTRGAYAALPALAICDHVSVLSANQAARDGGVRPGIKRATAQALLPDIHLLDHDPVREQGALYSLACWALQFTPTTCFAPPSLPTSRALRKNRFNSQSGQGGQGAEGIRQAPCPAPGQAGLLLEVEPSLRYFGGLAQLLATIHSGLLQLGYQAYCGVAPTPGAAWLITRYERTDALTLSRQVSEQTGTTDNNKPSPQDLQALPARLAGLPVHFLIHAEKHVAALQSIGAHTIGKLMNLPRAGLARRFGKNLLLEVDCALGTQSQPLEAFISPEKFASKMELMADIEQVDALLTAASRLLIELTGWLCARQAAVRHYDLLLFHDEPPMTAITVRLADPSRDPERLIGLLRERLNVVQLRAAVHTIELRCEHVHSLATPTQELFASPASTRENLGRLLERLQTRLGREQVQRLYLAEDHRPEAAYQVRVIDSLDQLGKPDRDDKQATGNTSSLSATTPVTPVAAETGGLPRPLWLLRQAQPLHERNNRPWLHSALNMVAGPERIETGWWDNHLVQRDYFVAEDEAHTLYWIYRERQAQNNGSGWYVQGRFG